jgi:hypothetical protein
MATYTLISSNVLASSAASVTFSAIPATYTDLVVKASIRGDYANDIDYVKLTLNGITSTVYSETYLRGTGSAAQSGRDSSVAYIPFLVNAATSTSNTFSNVEIYIPSYLASQNKPISIAAMEENNMSNPVYGQALASLYSQTTAISSITFTPQYGSNWLSGSSFYLYGISNA